ncbi:hypothetical protein [Paractinoplanes rishiriensis]|uniref:Uncharacterized protein n=1 Tax=Paractinoplanes rishiriensis TaxID=1050105 RepID=A0A919MRH9_9ACTN|nr:hypothetical protein [Actinoplanes rishiriensis]GIE92603.1 hypothetical protein Ari01nite_00680 [Actinoplanes rishiriensis]
MRHRTPIVLALAATLLASAGAIPAAATAPPALRLTAATVLTLGAAVDLRYMVFCAPAATFTVSVTLAQRTGRRVATATGETEATCTAQAQSVLLNAVPTTPSATFRPGSATATAHLRVAADRPIEVRHTTKRRLVAGSPTPTAADPRVVRATLIRSGDTAQVELRLTCPSGLAGRQNAGLYQGNRGRVATGWGSADLTCTGVPQRVLVTVQRDVTGEPFTLGPAMVDARAWGCAGGDCFAARPWLVFPLTR